ncbi:MAG TPA: hypothetical protein VKT53_01940 [Candidatus Acidoferrum sp.]|nr:hypothetical protein [Candidatus Acidoferrum sp.]
MPSSRSIVATIVAVLLAAAPLSAYQYPLSETSSRSAYFLGQRHDETTGEFLARYSKHLPPPRTGLYVSDISFLTPYAQLVQYSSHQGIYSAQQAELDGPKNLSTVEIVVYIYFSNPNISSTQLTGNSWRDYAVRVFDGKELREPVSVSGQSVSRCLNRGGCIRVGTEIFLSLPAEVFASDTATIEVTTPDDQLISVDFNLNSLR